MKRFGPQMPMGLIACNSLLSGTPGPAVRGGHRMAGRSHSTAMPVGAGMCISSAPMEANPFASLLVPHTKSDQVGHTTANGCTTVHHAAALNRSGKSDRRVGTKFNSPEQLAVRFTILVSPSMAYMCITQTANSRSGEFQPAAEKKPEY